MKLLKQLIRPFAGRRPVALFSIVAAGALSALVAGASIYLFLSAGRAQLPAPVVGEILAPAPVGALPAPPPIQTPPTVEAPAPETLVTGPFLVTAAAAERPVTAISQPAANESANAETVAAETGAVASPAGINGNSSQSASSPVEAQSGGSANNNGNHDSGVHNSGGNNAHDSADHNSGSEEHHDGGDGGDRRD